MELPNVWYDSVIEMTPAATEEWNKLLQSVGPDRQHEFVERLCKFLFMKEHKRIADEKFWICEKCNQRSKSINVCSLGRVCDHCEWAYDSDIG